MTSSSYRVQFSPHAAKPYAKLDPSVKPSLHAAMNSLRQSPLSGPKIKRLKGRLHAYSRYRVGDYRIVYVVVQHEHVIYVDYIQHRKDVYREIE